MKTDFFSSLTQKVIKFKEEFPVLDNRYTILLTIGQGRFGKVKLVYDNLSQNFKAVKILKKNSGFESFRIFLDEIEFMLQNQHFKNIIKCLDFNFKGVLKKQGKRY